jgi:hypothetical protein
MCMLYAGLQATVPCTLSQYNSQELDEDGRLARESLKPHASPFE